MFDHRDDIEQGWELVKPYSQDGFLVLIEDQSLFRIDWSSHVIWEVKDRFHHDMCVAENGDIYALRNRKVFIPEISGDEAILDNELLILSPQGRIKKTISLSGLLAKNAELLRLVRAVQKKEYSYQPDAWDVMHTNTVDVIENDITYNDNIIFKAGQVLLCMRHLNLVSVLDVEAESFVWFYGNNDLEGPHHPSMIEDGTLLIFDNGTRRGYSRIVEVDPVNRQINKEIKSLGGESFFTASRGSVQQLPQGNVLIVESEKGRVLELSLAGDIVWEFLSFPSQTHPGQRELLYRMPRITDPDILRILAEKSAALSSN
ncbi:MAG: arylsulfotransferase family protein [Planctomycetaceae bacterium]